jgi:peptide/nickel transport system permease protein
MMRYTIRRLLGVIPTILVLLLFVVLMIRMLPGNIVDLMLNESATNTPEARAEMTHRLGLDTPLPIQYGRYVLGVARGDLGKSLWDQIPVTETIASRALVTGQVAAIAIVVSVLISIPIGIISAVRRNSLLDYTLRSMSILGISLPSFVVATAVVILPALWFQMSLPFQYKSLLEDPAQNLQIVLPAAGVLGILLSATIARMMRTTMLDVLQQDYMRTARAKGLSTFVVVVRHGMKNALIPVVTLLGLQLTALIGGSVITESVFALPGLGRLLLESLVKRDYPIVQGVVVSVGLLIMFTNLLVDLTYGYLDPRIRYS